MTGFVQIAEKPRFVRSGAINVIVATNCRETELSEELLQAEQGIAEGQFLCANRARMAELKRG